MAHAELIARLDLAPRELVSLVGAGGKTTLLFALGNLLGGRRVMTTTTKMASHQVGDHERLVAPDDRALRQGVAEHGSVMAIRAIDGDKALGFDPEDVDRWFESDIADYVIVEADGARRMLCKAPGPLEPVIPRCSTYVVVLMAAAALGCVIDRVCHRPLRVSALAGCMPGERLTPARAARVLSASRGGHKGVPRDARTALMLTQVTDNTRELAEDLKDRCSPHFDTVITSPTTTLP